MNERELVEVLKMLDILDGIRLDRRWWELEGSEYFSCKSFRSFSSQQWDGGGLSSLFFNLEGQISS